MPKHVEPGSAIVALVRSPVSREVLLGLSEATFDQFMDEGFLRDVPLLGSLVGVLGSISVDGERTVSRRAG